MRLPREGQREHQQRHHHRRCEHEGDGNTALRQEIEILHHADARRLAYDEGLRPALTTHRLAALVAPTTGPAWPTDLAHGDRFSFSGSSIAAVAGTPSLTVPMGETRGLPLGLAFLGDRNREAELLALGHAFELTTHARTPPSFRPTAPPP